MCQWPLAHKGYVRSLYWPFHSYKMDSTVLDIQEQGQGTGHDSVRVRRAQESSVADVK